MSIDIHPNWTAAKPRARRPYGKADLAAADVPAPPVQDDPFAGLTPHRRAVALLAGRGLANCEIGRQLGIAESTVKNHLMAVYRRLGLSGLGWEPGRRLAYLVGRHDERTAGEEATDGAE